MDREQFTKGRAGARLEAQDSSGKNAMTLNVILAIVAAAIATAILFVTAFTLIGNKRSLEADYRRTDPEPQTVINRSKKKDGKLAAFTSLGEIRTVTKRPDDEANGTVMVVIPWFSYPEGDTVLYEELVQKTRQFRALFMEYFGGFTEAELRQKGELAIKDELKARINGELVLGSITDVYFSDYLFFE